MDAPAYGARSVKMRRSVKMQIKTPTSAFQNKILFTNTNEKSLESGDFKLCRHFEYNKSCFLSSIIQYIYNDLFFNSHCSEGVNII